jgi:hypothetical protein
VRKHRKQRIDFVILAGARTGSNMLCSLLNSHPEILCHHEVFNAAALRAGGGYALDLRQAGFSLGSVEDMERDPVEFLGRVWNVRLGHPCVGFKIVWRENEPIFRRVLMNPDVKKVLLKRRNRIKNFVSLLIARETGEWIVYHKSQQIRRAPRVRVPLPDLYAHVQRYEAYYRDTEEALRSSGQTFLRVDYEQLFRADERRRVLGFLGVRCADVRSLKAATKKLNSGCLEDLVSNFSELEAALCGTELAAELHTRGY